MQMSCWMQSGWLGCVCATGYMVSGTILLRLGMRSAPVTCAQWTFACFIRWWISACSGAGKGFLSALGQLLLRGHDIAHI